MLTNNDFLRFITVAIPRFGTYPPNPNQQACILHEPARPLMIVAGPGSGKTTVLVLRALRHVFVDGFLPENVVLTTFTRKAAEEIRSRLIEWGLLMVSHLRSNPPPGVPTDFLARLDAIDVNRFVTGTLDSICEETLTKLRHPGDPVPVVVEGFVANAILRNGIYTGRAHPSPDVDTYLAPFTFDGNPPRNFGEKLKNSRTLIDRFIHDEMDETSYRADHSHTVARNCIADSAGAYWASLDENNRLDFARLEQVFLDRLVDGRLDRFTDGISALLVDEYQDTNPLQQSIYFELKKITDAAFSIVGDDDQSLYRFRGATIELFRDFVANYQAAFPGSASPQTEYLVENYRSTPEIVGYFNDFISIDGQFTRARVQPPKPLIQAQLSSNGVPVLGLFRPDRNALADDLTDFLADVFRRGGRQIRVNGNDISISADSADGDIGDAVFLSHTVNEYAREFPPNPARERLPVLLRHRLAAHGIGVFNPRGRALRDIPQVQQIMGVILLCIDPPTSVALDGVQLEDLMARNALRSEATRNLRRWRQAGQDFIASNPTPNAPHTLADFVSAWQRRTPQGLMNWPDEWPLLELCFKIISWIPFLHDDPEGQVYLEAIARVIAQAATFSSYRSTIVFNDPGHATRSVQRAITDILAPIAENDVELDEDVMPHVPRDRLPFMTIHQAKGLEYPLVIVDVSSDYSTNNHMQRFRRFPESPSNVALLEDDLAPHCAIGPLRTTRTAIDRTFDDLVRLYYVAYSRPQCVLLLVGLDRCLRYNSTIRHVATGWDRNGEWAWQTPVSGRKPEQANNIPIQLI